VGTAQGSPEVSEATLLLTALDSAIAILSAYEFDGLVRVLAPVAPAN